MVTHLFNAQRPMHHREPGVPGQALTDARLTSGSSPTCSTWPPGLRDRVRRGAWPDLPGHRRRSVRGHAAGRYVLGGEPILPPGAGVPPVRADGTLAGSALRMDVAVANMVAAGAGLPPRSPPPPASPPT